MKLPDPEALYARLRNEIGNAYADKSRLALVGVHSGGAWIAQRLHRDLALTLPCGFLDSALYRDDFSSRGMKTPPKAADMPFDVNGLNILIVDDVLYTGRTTRAIINHVFDYGRPAKIDLAVLLDRGGRELPIAASFVGQALSLTPEQSFVLSRDDNGSFHLEMETKHA
ncbi:MAG: bifunctional pyr operon transcriptional regulator/uracil phosphoribosyltransferase PyrR [Burkholderiales bacterium]|jgi:pyrimidine operon attenuation protein/uracil phosphoribosyltransferase|nr:bifunctional pyr operon transcriptional regulator/uracil phosphoribosyltransferase PyrR [Burkholderiales bacterium]